MKKYIVNRDNSKNHKPYEQCYGKQQYNLKDARTKAKEVMKSGREKQVRVYSCKFCKSWHIAKHKDIYKEY